MDHKVGLTTPPESEGGAGARSNHKVGLTTPPESESGVLAQRIEVLEQHTKALAEALRALVGSEPGPAGEHGQSIRGESGARRVHELLHAAGLKPALD